MHSALHGGAVMLAVTCSLPIFCMQALLHLRKGVSPEFGPDISPLKLTVDESLPDVLHVKITDAGQALASAQVPVGRYSQ